MTNTPKQPKQPKQSKQPTQLKQNLPEAGTQSATHAVAETITPQFTDIHNPSVVFMPSSRSFLRASDATEIEGSAGLFYTPRILTPRGQLYWRELAADAGINGMYHAFCLLPSNSVWQVRMTVSVCESINDQNDPLLRDVDCCQFVLMSLTHSRAHAVNSLRSLLDSHNR